VAGQFLEGLENVLMDENYEQSGHLNRGHLNRDDAGDVVGICVSLLTFLAGALVYIICIIFLFRLADILA
jgi:hypothetical protein